MAEGHRGAPRGSVHRHSAATTAAVLRWKKRGVYPIPEITDGVKPGVGGTFEADFRGLVEKVKKDVTGSRRAQKALRRH